VYRKVPGLGHNRKCGLIYLILAAISFKIVAIGTYTEIPIFFFYFLFIYFFFLRFKSTVEVIFLNAVEYRL
jgi:hypothetical protein